MPHTDDGSSNSAPRAAYPPATYLGPLFLALIIGSSVGMASSTVTTLLPLHLTRMRGWSPNDVGLFLVYVGFGIGVITLVIQILAALLCYRSAMPWFNFLMTAGGRASRADYWFKYWLPFFALSILIYVPLIVVTALTGVIMTDIAPEQLWIAAGGQALAHSIFVELLLVWPAICVLSKRMHDRGKSAWFLLILLIPFVGAIWVFIEAAFLPGEPGDNRHGPDPRAQAA